MASRLNTIAKPARVRRMQGGSPRRLPASPKPALPAVVDPMAAVPVPHLVEVPAAVLPPGDDPRTYAMLLQGDCLAPVAPNGSMAIVSPASPLVPGQLVALFFRDGRSPQIKRLVALPPLAMLAAMDHPASTVRAAVMVEMLNPPRVLTFHLSDLSAIHAVSGVMAPGTFEARRVAPLAAAGSDTPPVHPDEALIRLGEQLVITHQAEATARDAAVDEPDAPGPLSNEASRFTTEARAIVTQIVTLRATTHAGLVVKLRAMIWQRGPLSQVDRDSPDPCTRMLVGMSDDLAAMDVTMAGPEVRS